MNKILRFSIFLVLFSTNIFAQKEGQIFCNGDITGSYFPLDISKKKIHWANTSYTEELIGEKSIDGNLYKEFLQLWESGTTETLYLREANGIIFEYNEVTKKDMVRYNTSFEVNHIWKTPKWGQYELLSYTAPLATPYCNYKNLMSIEVRSNNDTYVFYYLKGYGYVGAIKNQKLISYVSPKVKFD